MRLLEIHDRPWFPEFLRREVVDGLQVVLEATSAYLPVAPRLRDALDRVGAHRVLDLFSGAGGPWPSLVRLFEKEGAAPPEVFLTDKYPSIAKLVAVEPLAGHIHFVGEPVDATQIPEDLPGFRTIFSLVSGATRLRRRPRLAAFRRPFRWSRILWTYLIPVVPFVLLFDGVSSCLRAYSLADLLNLTDGLTTEDYKWEIGEVKGGWLPVRITYVIGCPKKISAV
jgi:hypothetical protein